MIKLGYNRKLVYGVGINDATYVTQVTESFGYAGGKQIQKHIWTCPIYSIWKDMLERCYSKTFKEKNPTYSDCIVCRDWLLFSKFREWVIIQDWEGLQLDKDILVDGNKLYSPATCCFVTKRVNSFIIERNASRGKYPIGVCWDSKHSRFKAQCSSVFTGKQTYLGLFDDPESAHKAWLEFKLIQAVELSKNITDTKIKEALVSRYKQRIEALNK